MEPITTTAMISTVVGYLAKKLKDNQSVQDFFNDFTDATVQWVRPLFIKPDNAYEKIIEDLVKNPDSSPKQQLVEATIASHLEDAPQHESDLKTLYEAITQKEATTNTAIVKGHVNKTYQGVSNSTITDSSVSQIHSGTGDNIQGDKKTYHIGNIDKADFS